MVAAAACILQATVLRALDSLPSVIVGSHLSQELFAKKMRLFLGIPLPLPVLAVATDVQAKVMKCAGELPTRLRPISLETHGHITLLFLGASSPNIPAILREQLQQKLLSEPSGFGRIRVRQEAATFNRKASLIYVPVTADEKLRNLQRIIRETSLQLVPSIANDRKEFNAHITIARANGGIRTVEKRQEAVRNANSSMDNEGQVESIIDSIVLYHSTREGQGKEEKLVYKELWKIELQK